MLREDGYKITQAYYTVKSGESIFHLNNDAWYKAGTGWSATNNTGTKYNSGSFIKMGASAGHPTIMDDIQSQLGMAAADYYNSSTFISKSNPVSTGNGNIEASDIESHAANTFTAIDPAGMGASIAPTYTFYEKGSFTTIDPSPVYSTNISIGGVVAVNPITSGEDTAATFYAAGSTITSDPTDYDVDPDAAETSLSHVLTASGAYWAIQKAKTALEQLSTDRASLGSVMGRLGRTSEQLGVLRENLDQAISRIRDTNVAQEATQFAKHKILTESSINMLKQANILPQHALRLILSL
jgi:flagellin-like hook-associated protein FlgL